jgi:hypothetical protein
MTRSCSTPFRSARWSGYRVRLAALQHVAVLLLLTVATLAQQSPPPLRGTWTATAGPKQVLHGTWSAQPVANAPNTANGSWSLVNASNQIVLSGTWAATKTPRSWAGTWSARVVTGRGSSGRVYSGTWRTEIKASETGTLGEMLQQTLQQEITGAWKSGAMSGSWSLKALK